VTNLWLSEEVTAWIGSILVGGLSAFWLVWDGLRLRRYLPQGRAAHDEIFGSLVGLTIAVLGIYGVIRFHLHRGG
jgi:hypothetical protein